MPKSPSDGNRPVPRVATGKGSPSFKNDSGREYGGVRATKDPSGNRPIPNIPMDTPPVATVPGKVKAPINHTPMPTPKIDAERALKGHAGGAD